MARSPKKVARRPPDGRPILARILVGGLVGFGLAVGVIAAFAMGMRGSARSNNDRRKVAWRVHVTSSSARINRFNRAYRSGIELELPYFVSLSSATTFVANNGLAATVCNQDNIDVPYVVTEPCIGVKDKSCMTVCPVDCIYEGDDMVYIHPDECIDCGLCEPECPVSAIFVDTDVPANWKDFIQKNAEESKKIAEK